MRLTISLIVFFSSVLAPHKKIIAQIHSDTSIYSWWEYFDQSFGNDYLLVNGIRYLQIPALAEGHPFMRENRFSAGRIVIGQKEFRGTELKYDICNQQIILNYKDFSGSDQVIVLVSDEINEFTLENLLFRKMELPEIGQRYVQVMEGDPVSCFFYWQKELVGGLSGEYYHRYLPEQRSGYLMISGELHPFRGKRSFINAFPEKYRKEIKGYLRSSYFLFREASDADLKNTLQFCNGLMKNGR